MAEPRTSASIKPLDGPILDFIVAYQREHRGLSPSIRDIAEGLGKSRTSPAPIHARMQALERQGRLKIHGTRNLEVLQPPPPTEAELRAIAATIPSYILAEELARRDDDPAWQRVMACGDCGERPPSHKITECNRPVCPMRIKEAA